MTFADQFFYNWFNLVDTQRKSHTLSIGSYQLSTVDTNDFSFAVHQSAAAVSAVDSGIGLNQCHSVCIVGQLSVQSADNPVCHSIFISQRIADGYHQFPDLQFIRIAQCSGRQILRFYFEHCQVAGRIGSYDTSVILVAVAQCDCHRSGILNHVIIGNHITVFTVNNT